MYIKVTFTVCIGLRLFFRLSFLGQYRKSSALLNINYTGADKPENSFVLEHITIKDLALFKVSTVELQWLEHLWDHKIFFETWVVRATDGARSGSKQR